MAGYVLTQFETLAFLRQEPVFDAPYSGNDFLCFLVLS